MLGVFLSLLRLGELSAGGAGCRSASELSSWSCNGWLTTREQFSLSVHPPAVEMCVWGSPTDKGGMSAMVGGSAPVCEVQGPHDSSGSSSRVSSVCIFIALVSSPSFCAPW